MLNASYKEHVTDNTSSNRVAEFITYIKEKNMYVSSLPINKLYVQRPIRKGRFRGQIIKCGVQLYNSNPSSIFPDRLFTNMR